MISLSEEIMRRFPCPRCGAEVEQGCATRTGKPAPAHTSRFDAAFHAGYFPFTEEQIAEEARRRVANASRSTQKCAA